MLRQIKEFVIFMFKVNICSDALYSRFGERRIASCSRKEWSYCQLSLNMFTLDIFTWIVVVGSVETHGDTKSIRCSGYLGYCGVTVGAGYTTRNIAMGRAIKQGHDRDFVFLS